MLDFWEAGGKRALWVSVGNDLRLDAIRDLSDIRATNIKVYPEVIGVVLDVLQMLPSSNLHVHHQPCSNACTLFASLLHALPVCTGVVYESFVPDILRYI